METSPAPTTPLQAPATPSSSKKTGFLKTFFIIIALILFGILIGVLASRFLPMPSSTITPTPTPTVTISVTPTASPSAVIDETADWLTYKNTLSRYTFKYPSNWKVLDLSEGTQVEVYYQPDKTITVGEIMIEKTTKVPTNIAQYTEAKTIGGVAAKCLTDKTTTKTICYLEIDKTNQISIAITKDQDPNYNQTLDQILSTMNFIAATSVGNYTCPTTEWVDCMPGPDSSVRPQCTTEFLNWAKANCPGFQGAAL